MTVTMTSEAVGKLPGDTYTGDLEAWLLAEGYASQAGYANDTKAVVTGSSNAVNIVTGGNLVLSVNGVVHTVALATSDTPAAVATKVDTALGAEGDSAVVSSKFTASSAGTGSDEEVKVISGTGTVLANLFLTAGQTAKGGDGGIGTSNTGLTAVPPAQDPTLASNREPLPEYNETTGLRDAGVLDPAMTFTTADDDPNDAMVWDFDPNATNDDAPVVASVSGTMHAAGGNAVTIHGSQFLGATGATLGGTAFTSFVVVDDETITAVSPAKTAGTYSLIVTNVTGTGTKTGVVVAA